MATQLRQGTHRLMARIYELQLTQLPQVDQSSGVDTEVRDRRTTDPGVGEHQESQSELFNIPSPTDQVWHRLHAIESYRLAGEDNTEDCVMEAALTDNHNS